jgi:TctA family transporter
MVVFGLIGFALEARRIPLAPLILGLILGPMIEENLRVGLINADGSFLPFFTSPISALLVTLLAMAYIVIPAFRFVRRRRVKPAKDGQPTE